MAFCPALVCDITPISVPIMPAGRGVGRLLPSMILQDKLILHWCLESVFFDSFRTESFAQFSRVRSSCWRIASSDRINSFDLIHLAVFKVSRYNCRSIVLAVRVLTSHFLASLLRATRSRCADLAWSGALIVLLDTSLNRRASLGLLAFIAGLRVLLQKQVVCCRQVVMLVIFNSSLHWFYAESQRCFQLHDELFIDCSGHCVKIVILSFWLEQAVPWVLL